MRLLFVGDVMLGRGVNQILKVKSPKYVWGDTLPVFQKCHFRVCNLECAISDWGTPWSVSPKAFHFRCDAKNVKVLTTTGINVVSLANNHVLDFEYEGLTQMLAILTDAGIGYAGAGTNITEVSKAAICEIEKVTIGLIAFTDNQPEWEATEQKPGILYVPVNLDTEQAKNLLEIIRTTRKSVDLLIVSAHWGPNWGYTPPSTHPPFAHALIDAGADIIFGHSGHIFRGIEIYRNRPIFYCTGDFIDDYAVDEIERNDQSFIFLVETQNKEILKISLLPVVLANCQAKLAKGAIAEEIVGKMRQLCGEFNTATIWNQKEQSLEILIQ